MRDLVFVLGAIAFFAAAIGYVVACNRLGRQAQNDAERP